MVPLASCLNNRPFPDTHCKCVSELSYHGMERSQASQKEPDRSNLDEVFTALLQALEIASQAPIADQPAKGPFDNPVTLPPNTVFRFCVLVRAFSFRASLV